MITGAIRIQIDQIWNTFWSGGIANPLAVIEQITYLLCLRRLDDLQTLEENKSVRAFRLLALGPIEQEARTPGRREHDQRLDLVAAMEKALAELLVSSRLKAMNRVVSPKPLDEARFAPVRTAFAKAFPQLAAAMPVVDEPGMANGR